MPIVNYPFVYVQGSPKPALPVILQNPANGFEQLTWALIDTGADYTVIPEFIAKDLYHDITHASVKKSDCTGVGGIAITYQHTFRLRILESVGKGNISNKTVIQIRKRLFAVVQGLNTMVLGENDFLKKYILTIDYTKKLFSVRSPF
jgi:hypothetical protein